MARNAKEVKPGDVVSIRRKKDTPLYIISLINEVLKKEGSSALLVYLVASMKQQGIKTKKGIYIPLPSDMIKEEIHKIEDNEPLMVLLGNIIKSSVSLDHPLLFSLGGDLVVQKEARVDYTPTQELEEVPPKPKIKSNGPIL